MPKVSLAKRHAGCQLAKIKKAPRGGLEGRESLMYHRRLVLQQPEKQRLALKDVVAGDVFSHGLKHLVRVVAQ
jgi:hypothetical protein